LKRLYPSQPLVGVAAIIVYKGKLLLTKRKAIPGKGKWTIPGGLVELGENSEQTVIREVKEEANIVVVKPKLFDVYSNIVFDDADKVKYHFVIIYYSVKYKGGEIMAGDDAAELRWVPFHEVEKYDLTRSFREIFQRNRRDLEKLEPFPKV